MPPFFSSRLGFGRLYSFAAMIVAATPMACVENHAAKDKYPPRIPVTADALKFEMPELKKRFESFDAAARELAGKGFEHRALGTYGGNFVNSEWCKGIALRSERVTMGGPIKSLKLIHRINIEALVIPLPDVRATALHVELVAPSPDEWCVYFHYCEGKNQNTYEPGWLARFFRWAPGPSGTAPRFPEEETKERIDLPISGYPASASRVALRSDLSPSDNFVRYAKSADSFRDACLADLAQLEARVLALIQAHKAEKKVYEKRRGGGVPPSHLEPLNADEEKAEITKAREHFAAQARLIRTHHQKMYETLRKSFPFERCWPELAENK